MRVIIEPNYDLMSQWAANYVVAKINAAKPTAEKPFVLGLPTGSSPIGMYRGLVKAYQEGKVSFKNVVTFNMDEYVGLPVEHPESYHSFMYTNLFNHIDCPKENIHILNGNAKDLAWQRSVQTMRRRSRSLVASTCSWVASVLMAISLSMSQVRV